MTNQKGKGKGKSKGKGKGKNKMRGFVASLRMTAFLGAWRSFL
jgi:hypothetical protein